MTECLSPLVRPLGELSSTDLPIAGGKGANLGELLRAGFPVPDGFVVTTAGYDAFVAANDLDARLAAADSPDAVAALFRDATMPTEIADAVVDAYRRLGDGPVAVRSSATAEDLPGASFAGQQDTYLNITGADRVLDAIRRCWASLWNERAVAYRERAQHDASAALSIAVVVQRLVPAEVAGVMFTANPANGRCEQTVITAAWGLGEAVVGGLVEPDEYVVDRSLPEPIASRRIAEKKVMTVRTDGGSEQIATPASQASRATLSDAQVLELAALGERVQQHFGCPQDIEWTLASIHQPAPTARPSADRGLADGVFQLVQARPITALPEPIGDVPTDWPLPQPRDLYFRASIVEQLPDPLTPLFADLIRVAVPIGLNKLLAAFNPKLVGTGVDFPTINGYAYYEYSRAALGRMSGLTPVAILMLSRKDFVLDRWHDHALPDYRAAVAGWVDRYPAALPASELIGGVRDLLTAACIYYSNVQMVIPAAALSELTWTGLYNALLRRDGDPQASDFLLGFDSTPVRAEKSLHALGVWCRTVPGLADALDAAPAADVLTASPEGVDADDWAAFVTRLRDHLSEFGHTIYNLDFANPVPADDPTPVLEALKHAIAGRSADPEQRQRETTERRERLTRELLARLDPVRRTTAAGSLATAQLWAPIREDALAAMGLAWPTIRRLLRELGGRLTGAGAIARPDDVFWLTAADVDAASAALDAGTERLDDHSASVEQRRREWRGRQLASPPQYLPVSGWISWMDSMMPAHEGEQTGPVLKGTGGSGGRVTAPARVLAGPDDFAAFQPGEILVAPITTPAYTPLFALASGVVTDVGGVLSHGSIVAREYGIPAVLGTGSATKRIRTGDVITVDGAAGTVRLTGVDEPDEAPASPRVPTWAWVTAGTATAAVGVALMTRHRRHEPIRG
ncbi:MAG: PEP/pyruvate-binding domain-containing protein [Micropruina sp.]|uniref:PEP/pyruvate-binding domain-containing protein n=1 Tax=Micropruina sp. TaxID=2737536 RepID=UPI0039E6048E